ncbi:MAG: hypothetical protein ACNA7Y_04070, partial [Gammaproteobacteria bacterium]
MFKFFLWALGLHLILLIIALLNFNFFSKKNPVTSNNPIKAVAINPNALKPAAAKAPPTDMPLEKPAEQKPTPKSEPKPEPKSEPKSEPKPEPKSEPLPESADTKA